MAVMLQLKKPKEKMGCIAKKSMFPEIQKQNKRCKNLLI